MNYKKKRIGPVFGSVQYIGWDSIIGIASRYGLDSPRIKSCWGGGGEILSACPNGHGVHPAFCIMGTKSLLGVKWPDHGMNHPPLSSATINVRVQLYLFSLSAFMAGYRVTFTFDLLNSIQ